MEPFFRFLLKGKVNYLDKGFEIRALNDSPPHRYMDIIIVQMQLISISNDFLSWSVDNKPSIIS